MVSSGGLRYVRGGSGGGGCGGGLRVVAHVKLVQPLSRGNQLLPHALSLVISFSDKVLRNTHELSLVILIIYRVTPHKMMTKND